MATEPLGKEALSSVYKADQMYGTAGMPYSRLRRFIQAHLQEMSPALRKQLAESPPIALGYGKNAMEKEKRNKQSNERCPSTRRSYPCY